ncbi:MAG: 7TM diverse intracellular signaling domain-containing protein [Ketobacteraceae bacterium]|nr:7TM diverse intracellular signaling domain-containing protein [Ketobacteraceae bacterium]
MPTLSPIIPLPPARKILEIDSNKGVYDLAPYLYYLEDPGARYSIEMVADPQNSDAFIRNKEDVLGFGYVDSVYWLRTTVSNLTQNQSSWLIELIGMGRSIDQIQIFIQEKHGFRSYVSGDAIPFDLRPLKHHAVLFPVNIPKGETVNMYFRVSTNGTLQIPLLLWSEPVYLEHEHNNMLMDGIFYGVLFIMIMYNAFIFLTIRDISYFHYVFYLISVVFFAASLRGLGFEYFWPDLPWWNNKSNLFFAELTVGFIILFAKSFLEIKANLPTIDKILKVLLWTLVPGFYLVLFGNHYQSATFLSLQFLSTIALVITAATLCYRRGFKAARLYLLAWLGMLTMIVFWILNNFHLISSYFLGTYGIQVGAVLQVALFSFALADRINLMKKQREEALQQRLIETQKVTTLTNTFERFVPRQFLKRLAHSGSQYIELGKAETDIITILFSDIRDFTHLSEGMSPQELLNFLNAYFNRMDRPIHQSGGFIDKFVGDAILAIFESNHYEEEARNAVKAAIAMQEALKEYNQHRAKVGYPPLDIGVGINTGPVIIGTVGTQDRMDTTVLGDVVNLASRLEKLTKKYRVKIICSSYTLDLLDNASGTLTRELDYVKVRGKQKAVRIYEVFNADEENVRILKQRLLLDYQQAMALYYNRRWEEAAERFQLCLDIFPGDVPSHLYLSRCREYQKAPPPDDWDFSWKLED